jgi:tRNA pseudouridine55 synthase
VKSGILLVDKPSGMSSHAVVSRARRALDTRRIGHAGTLDPMATGVLVLAVGEGCKVVRYLVLDDKRYDATIQLGVETDTLDADGAVTATCAVPAPLELERVRAAALAFIGEIAQRAPDVSAIKQGGVALHARVRRGETVQAPERRVVVRSLVIDAVRPTAIDLSVHSGKGFYVRALARDLAHALGTVGHLTALRRVQSGCFGIERTVRFEQVAAAASGDGHAREVLEGALVPIRDALALAPALALDDAGLEHARHGRSIPLAHVASGVTPEEGAEPVLLCDPAGQPIAVARRVEDALHVVRGLSR